MPHVLWEYHINILGRPLVSVGRQLREAIREPLGLGQVHYSKLAIIASELRHPKSLPRGILHGKHGTNARLPRNHNLQE